MKIFFFNLLFFTFLNNFSYSQNIYSELANEIKNSEKIIKLIEDNDIQSVCMQLNFFSDMTQKPKFFYEFYFLYSDSLFPGLSKDEKSDLLIDKYYYYNFTNEDTNSKKLDFLNSESLEKRCGLVGIFSNSIDNKIFCEIYYLSIKEFNDFINTQSIEMHILPALVFVFEISENKIIKQWVF